MFEQLSVYKLNHFENNCGHNKCREDTKCYDFLWSPMILLRQSTFMMKLNNLPLKNFEAVLIHR